jgi:hypothetical protein
MWHAASVPEALRRLYGNWLLDCRVCKKMRISMGRFCLAACASRGDYPKDAEKSRLNRTIDEAEASLSSSLMGGRFGEDVCDPD